MLQGTWHIAYKELLHIIRDRRTLILILVMPAVLTVLFGYALESGDIRDIPTAIFDADQTSESFRIVDGFRNLDPLAVVEEVSTLTEAKEALRRGKVKVVVVVPKGFADTLRRGEQAEIMLLLDGTDNRSAPLAQGAAHQVVRTFNFLKALDSLRGNGIRPDKGFVILQPVGLSSEIWFNPGLRFANYVMPGVIGLTLQLLTVTLMAMTITRERERGTLDQLIVTPVSRASLFLGKLLPYFMVSMLNVAMVLYVAYFWFDVPLGNRTLLFLFCAVFVLSSLATGLLISAISRSQFQATQIAVFYILPVFLLSGAFAPLEAIPEYVRPVSYLFPLTYFARAVRAITLREAGFSLVWRDFFLLVTFALVMLYWSVIMFRKKVA